VTDRTWSIVVEQKGEHAARVSFVPQGAAVSPTFAVRHADFERVAIPATGRVALCGGRVEVRVRPDGQPPHRANLEIHWTRQGRPRTWRPGDLDRENLGAPFLALDNLWRDYIPSGVHAYDPLVGFDPYVWDTAALTWAVETSVQQRTGTYPDTEARNAEIRRLLVGEAPSFFTDWPEEVLRGRKIVRRSPPGLLSRSGLTLFRDDTRPWDPQTEWIAPRADPQPFVFYLIYHDCDWKLAARELVQLLGPIPKIPPFFLGVWYSNYSELGQKDFERIASQFAEHDLPLDVISVDMNWHGSEWYGYEWNEDLFPDPPAFARWLREQNLRATFNVHPLYVPATDARLPRFREACDHSGPALGAEGDRHPLQAGCVKIDIHDRQQADAYFEVFHRPIEAGGADFWWIDGSVRLPDGRDECSWLNHAYRAHLARDPDRVPIVLARAGGLGSHRDAIGFTGDACSQWEVLAFEVETLVRAAGALMAYVSHDIGGFYHDPHDRQENKPPDDLYLRWVQFGCLSPIMRLHSFDGVREPWRFEPRTLAIARRFMQLRIRLAPYTWRLVEEAHATGLVPARPMWFEFDDEDAYQCLRQYMLGDALLVAPVVSEDSTARYWLPGGLWHDAFSDRTESGPRWIEEKVPVEIIPLWLRDGASLDLADPAPRVSLALAGPRRKVEGAGWARETR
jgi:hypothetical protein